jgi:hypothetical protein
MQGNIELKGDKDFTSISLLNKNKIEKLKAKYPKMKYLHIGLIQLKITGLFRTGIDTPIMIVCMDERIINNPLNSIIGGAKSNLANRLLGVNIHPDFCISLCDDPDFPLPKNRTVMVEEKERGRRREKKRETEQQNRKNNRTISESHNRSGTTYNR